MKLAKMILIIILIAGFLVVSENDYESYLELKTVEPVDCVAKIVSVNGNEVELVCYDEFDGEVYVFEEVNGNTYTEGEIVTVTIHHNDVTEIK